MSRTSRARPPGRALVPVWAGAAATMTGAATLLLAQVCHSWIIHPGLVGPAGPLVAIAAAGCALVLARLTICALVTAVAAAAAVLGARSGRGERLALRLSPVALRPLVALALTGGLAVASVAPASAASDRAAISATSSTASSGGSSAATPGGHSAVPATGGSTAPTTGGSADLAASPGLPAPGWQALPDPGWRPSAPPPVPALADADVGLVTAGPRQPLAHRGERPDDTVVVRRGDSLWRLAARHLGPGASDAEVAAAWPHWWAANRSVVGDDPNLLLPGMRLVAPSGDGCRR